MILEILEKENKKSLELEYKTFGQPKNSGPTVLILHALTGNSTVAGPSGWWKEIVGEHKAIDLTQVHVVAIDIPGNGASGEVVNEVELFNAKIIARIIVAGLKEAGYDRFDFAYGGSLGGGLLWEIIVCNPNWIKKAFIIAAHYQTSSWLKGITHVQNEILKNSATPIEDSRKMAMLFYRSPAGFSEKFIDSKEVSVWLEYHGQALKNRFSIDAYRFMNHLLGSINATEGYSGIVQALMGNSTEIILVGIDTDLLFPAIDNIQTYKELRQNNIKAFYHEIVSPHGHDSFLIEFKQLEKIINQHITKK